MHPNFAHLWVPPYSRYPCHDPPQKEVKVSKRTKAKQNKKVPASPAPLHLSWQQWRLQCSVWCTSLSRQF